MFSSLQKLLPKHLLSRIVGWLSSSESRFLKTPAISIFCFFCDVDLAEAVRENKSDYRSFNDFFTRELKPGSRRIEGRICSPADGTVAAFGDIEDGMLLQSKNHNYSIAKLIADPDVSDFVQGSFITVYLAPHNYHRVHMPCTAELHNATYIPGDLFSVNQATVSQLPDLFARNERLVCRFRTGDGPMAAVLVGAMLVAGIQPAWLNKPYRPRLHVTTEMKRVFQQGEELGQFQMGSTVILLFKQRQSFIVNQGDQIRFGQPIVSS